MNKWIVRLFFIIGLNSFILNSLATEGGSCQFVQETVLVQIQGANQGAYVLTTSGNKRGQESDDSERLFYLPINKINSYLSTEDYFVAVIKHSTSGSCVPLQVVSLEKLTLGKIQLTIDESLYYGGAFRLNEVQQCVGQAASGCENIKTPQYNDQQIKVIRNINPKTLTHCSLSAIRKHSEKLIALSSTKYYLGCAFSKNRQQEFPVYFEMINNRLEFRGVLFQ